MLDSLLGVGWKPGPNVSFLPKGDHMRLLVIVLVGLFLVGNAHAKEQTAQQKKMSACAKANKGKKGDEYKNAMS